MTPSIKHLSAITLFVEDLSSARAFYQDIFGAQAVYADDNSVAMQFDNLIVNLLESGHAAELVGAPNVGGREERARFQLSVWVSDVDAVYTRLRGCELTSLSGPQDRPWGMRTISFVDPAGHNWEVAQRMTK